ncbi:unnamed protein product [Bursaphelenchus okinawaensis]|uniref:Uncharacterized protein n=1 Tax=Bursaphelenchus okinawaensis TaxID=465554 RepID=A0A811LEH9_9BILA|nr:unnamed protein product [Bursaphelenchus okinawaensis]CAG9121729.1 unnamed protein product [Bursaphelenchus okinawaensis]
MTYMFAARCRGEPVKSNAGNYCVAIGRDLKRAGCVKEAAIPTGLEIGYAPTTTDETQYSHYIKFTHNCHEHGDGEVITGIAFADHYNIKPINIHICGDQEVAPSVGYNFGAIELSQLNHRKPAS